MSMSMTFGVGDKAAAGLRRRRRFHVRLLWLISALPVILAAQHALSVLEAPGHVLERELEAAGAEMHVPLVPQPTSAMRQAIRQHFAESAVQVDVRRSWPNVAVTLSDISRDVCGDAVHDARRIDGSVVIVLEHFRTPTDCRERNEMTWWIMP
jgi:hypothetical protein